MISLDEGRAAAEEFLDKHIRGNFDFRVVIVEGSISDLGRHWLFPYDGIGYAERGDWREAMAGNVPILVDKQAGVAVLSQ